MGHEDGKVHLEAIRRALANGNAAVMVGAGFSCNAEGGHQLKTWLALGEELWNALNPGVPPSALSSGVVTRLGEQYARVFSRPALEDLLKRHIPDDRVVPGALHDQLLRLPWCEIFTTNYDTLLERTAENIFERAHLTICCREDIPQSKVLGRRRIVKLHGSFPSQRPFIFTEEDYRTYPGRFAPFVNLVRQSLLENVFCLIGFSGDDPNFLNWIGWVRDMLDRHTLPIYLFVSKPPSLGESKLLEARHVVPVVLPMPIGSESNDYAARYRELFRLLAPAERADEDWGDITVASTSRTYDQADAANFEQMLSTYSHFSKARKKYPGWLVAPEAVRQRLEANLNSFPDPLHRQSFIEHLDKQPSSLVLLLLSQHHWQQDVLLQPLHDNIARLAIQILKNTHRLQLTQQPPDICAKLEHIDAFSQCDFEQSWLSLALGLLRWARQALDDAAFESISSLLSTAKAKDLSVEDEIQYESVLLSLYRGDRFGARKLLSNWKIKGADPYMLVRKGALQAEVGETELGLVACMDAIQTLRRSQKIEQESVLLRSQEAWACLIAHQIKQSLTFFDFGREKLEDEDLTSLKLFGRRLADIAAKGYDVRVELKAILANLDAEASPPSAPRYAFGGFDLGHISTTRRFGWSTELRSKVQAAFAWLTLADRVGLTPRSGDVMMHVTAYTQAGWWIQYADSTQRVLSIAIRALYAKILEPKDESTPRHKSGWLSRCQVAKLAVDLATDMAERSLFQVETNLASGLPQQEVERVCQFHIKIFSRLVIRVEAPEKVLGFAKRVTALHANSRLISLDNLWKDFSTAIARCFEALPTAKQIELVFLVAELPLLPSGSRGNHFRHYWLQTDTFLDWLPSAAAQDLRNQRSEQIVDELLQQLRTHSSDVTTKIEAEVEAIWKRLMWLDYVGLLSGDARTKVGEILWRNGGEWPVVPGYHQGAATRWPAPGHVNRDECFRRWILSRTLALFSGPSSMTVKSSANAKAWGLNVGNGFLEVWTASMRDSSWPPDDICSGLGIVKNWWDKEGAELVQETKRLEELHEVVLGRLELVDHAIATACVHLPTPTQVVMEPNWQWVNEWVDSGAATLGAPFWRYRLCSAKRNGSAEAMRHIEEEIAAAFLHPKNEREIYQARNALYFWTNCGSNDDTERPALLVEMLVSMINARCLQNLSVALDVLKEIVRKKKEWLTSSALKMTRLALQSLATELNYHDRPPGSGIPDDEVPLLRYRCASLALALQQAKTGEAEPASQTWLDAVQNDPLPELRLRRFYAALDVEND